jgi:vacuolar protein sorting-associated protein 13A/C
MLVGAVLQALEIEDKFHGHVSHSCKYLARSYIKNERKEKGGHDGEKAMSSSSYHSNRKSRDDRQPQKEGNTGGTKQLTNDSGTNSRNGGSSKSKLSHYNTSGDERFFDANDDSGYESSSSSFSSHKHSSSDAAAKFYDAEDDQNEPPSFKREVGLLPGSASPEPSKDDRDVTDNEELKSFVKAQVILTSPESPTYASIDKEVSNQSVYAYLDIDLDFLAFLPSNYFVVIWI